jgi:hypothetical protein
MPVIGSEVATSNHPIMDGIIGDIEWIHGDRRVLSMHDGSQFETTLVFNDTHLFVLFQIADDDPTKFEQDVLWDAVGVEFDNNGDQVPMGLYSSPDDAFFVSYSSEGGKDFLLQGMGNPAVEDVSVDGTNDVEGSMGIDSSLIIIEACKKLDSGDEQGADITLSPGTKFSIMFAYWDNIDIHSQSIHSNWISFTVPTTNGDRDENTTLLNQIILELTFLISFVLLAVIVRFRTRMGTIIKKTR